MNKPFAEIIESSLTSFIAQTWQWDTFPTFGSLVVVESGGRTIFGIVHEVQTGSLDPVRQPFPYQKTEQELLREQPQIFEFLKTTFTCLVIGAESKGKISYQLAPQPTKIHAFVTPASKQKAQDFFADERWLHLLFGSAHQVANLDELLLATLTYIGSLKLLTDTRMEQFIHSFSLLTGNDYRRLKLFLQRAQAISSF